MRALHAIALLVLPVAAGLSACSDRGTPTGPAIPRASFVESEETMPNSGFGVAYPQDGGAPVVATMRFSALAAAPAPVPTVRIGVVQSANAVTLGSSADFLVSDKANGLPLLSGTDGSVTVTLDAAPESFYRLQVMCGSTAAVAARKAQAEAVNVVTFTEFVPTANCTRLFLGQFAPPPASNFAARNAFRNSMIAAGLAASDSFWKVVSVGGNTLYRITSGTTSFQSLNPVVVTSSLGRVTINGAVYRGKGEARRNGQSALAGINELPVEDYLYGVVPRELGPIAYPELEALKAQAVAARTYALGNIGRRGSDGYDLRATTDDQVYGGYSAEYPLSSQAVDETHGIVATYQGRMISALYFSTSGGHTADNEESFDGAPADYLRGIPDAERGAALDHVQSLEVFMAHANPRSLRAAKEGDFESDWSRYHRWTFEWTMSELASVLSTSLAQTITRVDAMNVVERGPSGRVLTLDIVTDAGTFTVRKGAIRAAVRYLDAGNKEQNLPSTLFFVEAVRDPRTKATSGFRVYGGGFGHGVGMSQTGAVGMAEKGSTFDQILKAYYRGIDLTSLYGV